MEKLSTLNYELQYGYDKLFFPCEIDEVYGRALNMEIQKRTSKISNTKEINNLDEKEDIQKIKTNFG